jgi:Cu/Ag efflux protein CusF
MRKLLIGIAALGLAASGAWAHDKDNKSADNTKASDTMKADTNKGTEVTGQLSKFDKDTRSVTIALPSGDSQVLKLASDAKITRDGSDIGLEELKPGSNVRASFDPKTNQATKLDITSKSDKDKTMR